MVTAIEPSSSSDSDTPGMFPGLSNVGLGTEEGSSSPTPSCDNPPETALDNPDDDSVDGLKDVVKTVISDFVMEHAKKGGRKIK